MSLDLAVEVASILIPSGTRKFTTGGWTAARRTTTAVEPSGVPVPEATASSSNRREAGVLVMKSLATFLTRSELRLADGLPPAVSTSPRV